MVKADAYGLGVGPVVQALEALDPWGYGVATIEEGAELRSLGITRPVLVFTPLLADDFAEVREHRLTPTLGDEARIHAWHSSGGGEWHLAVDTGMNRAGVPWDRVADLSWILSSAPPEGAFTHFHSADLDDGSMDEQLRRFDDAVSQLPARPEFLHAENSPALERSAPSRWDLARPGVSLYGVGSGLTITDPAVGSEVRWSWLPVASLHARIVELRDVADGETVSYGATWTRARCAPHRHGGRRLRGRHSPQPGQPRRRARERHASADRRRRHDGHDDARRHRRSRATSATLRRSSADRASTCSRSWTSPRRRTCRRTSCWWAWGCARHACTCTASA